MYVGAESPRDHVLIDGSPRDRHDDRRRRRGRLATAAIVVNSIPKLLAARPGLLTMRDLPLVHRLNPLELRELAGAKKPR